MAIHTAEKTIRRWRWPDWRQWLRSARPAGASITLGRRHIYILPTRAGMLFATTLVCMLIGAINYSLSLGFLLTFLLTGLGLVAMLHTWRNLVNLSLTPGRTPAVFAGQHARFPFTFRDETRLGRYAIRLTAAEAVATTFDIEPKTSQTVQLAIPATTRGWLRPGRLTLSTEFPLGLFHAWSYADPDVRCLVYARPAPPGLPIPGAAASDSAGRPDLTVEEADFAGLRDYRQGDAIRTIDWKASARSQNLLSKHFAGNTGQTLMLNWQDAPGGDVESRISQLTRWVLDAHDLGVRFGLTLPNQTLTPTSGEAHCEACLQALALYGIAS